MTSKNMVTGVAVAGVALLAAVVVGPAVAHATEPFGGSARRVAPAAGMQPLSSLIGSWNCSGSITAPDGSKKAFATTSTAKFILNGNFMRWQETNSMNGTPIASAEYIWGWDAQHKYFTVDRFDDSGQRGAQTSPGWVGAALTASGALVQSDGSSISLTTTLTKTGKKALTVRAVVNLGAAAGGATVVSESSCTR
ncbi:DUF1579 family protein [Couchioplanes caeruleus]|uniref:Uncharacterized protein DUF1579 n=1 Tax=Couchioplanes caeruleus TaxID=56438 RepID=A0A3N1GM96_9ACTN|nr:DUF1579 family protein [Couchioplanes caeruleus]ROP31329.1 uncharacterized protein DUF1579 [Couchioplanes caeruleus]